ncbi:MAG: hypothetical protein ACOYYU_04955 [Chloroflexota bacterium]
MKNRIVFAFLLITLAACTPVVEPAETPAQPTLSALVAAVTTADALTQAARFPSPPPTVAIVTPSPLPTQPVFPVITPDAAQVERWKEYEDVLARTMFPSSFIPGEFLCEWEILGRTEREVYVWAVCMSVFPVIGNNLPYHAEMPIVIFTEEEGAIHHVERPGGGTSYASDIRRMFPPEAQERYFDKLIPFQELTDHLRWRREHPEEPPLIVLSTTPVVIPTP